MLLREKDKTEIINLATKSLKQSVIIWAFGSRVNGEAHDTSDLDLVLIAKDSEQINTDDFFDFKEQLIESNIPILIQVLDWNRIPTSFHKNILNNYEELAKIRYK